MKKSLVLFCPLLFGTFSMVLFKNAEQPVTELVNEVKASTVISCGPGTEENDAAPDGKFITLMPGWGNHSYRVSTQNDSAQVYFNQGLSMYYSYHAREAIASFKEAARFDSGCAMAYWGQALAMGPGYNGGFNYKMKPAVPAVLEAMNRVATTASSKEKELIAAMNQRYHVTDSADKQRKVLNIAYTDALKPLVAKYPDDLDIKALYVDAVMLLHSWDFWWNDGTPKQWTPQLVQYCKDILDKDPHHPAALHYYIHVTEASRNPQVALSSADSLIKLFPGVAHMVHMSSHEYERIGYYAKGVIANEKADRSLFVYDSLAKGMFPRLHIPHYYAVDAYCALSGAMYKKGLQKSLALRGLVQPVKGDYYDQYLYVFPQLAMVRMGKWQQILQDTTSINSDWTYAGIFDDFAKGMAYVKTGNVSMAKTHLTQLREKEKDEALKKKFYPLAPSSNTPYHSAEVAENILLANILFTEKKKAEAVTALEKAIVIEDSLIYEEPKIWMLPARQWLGAFYLQWKEPGRAEKIYREDLVWNPGNGWSLLGLYQALKAQGKTAELKILEKRFKVSFSEAEEIPISSAY